MSIVLEIRRRGRLIIGPVLGISLVCYFAYHLVQGDRGLMVWMRLHQQVHAAEITLAQVTAERTALQHRVELLRPDHLDRDMLDERARSQLNEIAPHEIVIFNNELPR